MFIISFCLDEIFSVTQSIQQEEIEHEEEVVHHHSTQPVQIHSTSVCVNEATSEIVEEVEEEEEETVYTLAMSEESEGEDKEYLGNFEIFFTF